MTVSIDVCRSPLADWIEARPGTSAVSVSYHSTSKSLRSQRRSASAKPPWDPSRMPSQVRECTGVQLWWWQMALHRLSGTLDRGPLCRSAAADQTKRRTLNVLVPDDQSMEFCLAPLHVCQCSNHHRGSLPFATLFEPPTTASQLTCQPPRVFNHTIRGRIACAACHGFSFYCFLSWTRMRKLPEAADHGQHNASFLGRCR